MGKAGSLFFPIKEGWDTNKVAAIIDGKAYRTLGSYSIWGATEGRKDMREHVDAISRGLLLLDSANNNLPTTIQDVEPMQLDTFIMSGQAALVALVPENQQMNDTINVRPHTTCKVSYCSKPLQPTTPEEPMQPTTPEEDTFMLFRGERESAPSPEPDSSNLQVLGTRHTENRHGDTDEPDPNLYTQKLLDLKREPQNPDLEAVLNQEITQPTIEDRILEVRHIMEEDRELREQEIAGVLQIMDQGQNETRENIKIIMGALNENKESFQAQTNVMKEAFTLLNRQMANQLKLLSKCIGEQMAELAQEIRAAIIPPPPSPLPPPPPLSESFFTLPTGEIRHMIVGTAEEAAETLARAISEKPCRDSYVEGNSPICNLGASGAPPNIPSKEAIKPDTKPKDPDTYMTNNAEAETEAMIQKADANPLLDKDNARNGRQTTPPHTRNRAQDTVEAEVTSQHKTSKSGSVQLNQHENRPEDKPKTAEAKVTVTTQTSAQKGVIRDIGAYRGRNSNRKPTKDTVGKEREDAAANSNRKPSTIINNATHPGTGANATPIGPSRGTTPPKESTPLAHGKPERIQRTCLGEGYWEQGPKNTADIENTADVENTSRPTSVQVLLTGCPTIPTRGDSWKRSFLAGFNAKRERLAPEMPICVTHVSFAFSYPSERVVTIHHPTDTKHEEIIRAVARVRREMYNNYIQHPNESLVSILQETTELVAPGLQGTRGEKAWDRAESICRDLKLTKAARPPKWLVKGKGDGYEGKKCSLRFSVTTASLRAIRSPLPIVYNKNKIYLYQRRGDKAFYVDELKYMAVEPCPSHSPKPVRTWGACTYCHRLNHTEDTCWSKKNAQL
ncbi:hypothetical protein L211DRAFT_852905 [Terfezia boudieri ATCC MYA-4762]|uniref:Uncharacterized protein n=1 Tax=Terfezia boudieri ATCC MYA-4762 TaxID=1051890 RepID=A0A3N4LAV9_9PEZI|nr:hypothetical protein L211DRAFT_852905 [Terfezia boudieri ATCC MYA-4762]